MGYGIVGDGDVEFWEEYDPDEEDPEPDDEVCDCGADAAVAEPPRRGVGGFVRRLFGREGRRP